MFKRTRGRISVFLLCAVLLAQSAAALQAKGLLGQELAGRGVIEYSLNDSGGKKFKLMVEKDSLRYTYDIKSGDTERFPLQMGSGSYTVTLLENIEGIKYRAVNSDRISVSLENENDVFLNSVQNVRWSAEDAAVKKAQELAAQASGDGEKISAVYKYVASHIVYDRVKAQNVTSGYLPDIDSTYASGKGICYDYAALTAAMLRSLNVPAKLVMGKSSLLGDQYHAWNEVYDGEAGKWLVIDATYDAPLLIAGKEVSMAKREADYKTEKIY